MSLFNESQIERLRKAEEIVREVYLEVREVAPQKVPGLRITDQSEEIQDLYRLTAIGSMLGRVARSKERMLMFSGTIVPNESEEDKDASP